MKFKVKKIRNVDKNICFAEQKIAYNYAFSWRDILEKIYKSDKANSIKNADYQTVINWIIDGIKEQEIDKKYNLDAIIHCLRNGLEDYLSGFSILTSYEDIGKTFKCLYEFY